MVLISLKNQPTLYWGMGSSDTAASIKQLHRQQNLDPLLLIIFNKETLCTLFIAITCLAIYIPLYYNYNNFCTISALVQNNIYFTCLFSSRSMKTRLQTARVVSSLSFSPLGVCWEQYRVLFLQKVHRSLTAQLRWQMFVHLKKFIMYKYTIERRQP